MSEKIKQAFALDDPSAIRWFAGLAATAFMVGGVYAGLIRDVKDNAKCVSEYKETGTELRQLVVKKNDTLSQELYTIREDIIKEIAILEADQKALWKDNETEHDDMVEYIHGNENLMRDFYAATKGTEKEVQLLTSAVGVMTVKIDNLYNPELRAK